MTIDIMAEVKPNASTLTKKETGMEIVKYPVFLSPSSLSFYEKQPHKYFCERMAVNPRPREPQGIAAAAGSAFDAAIKVRISKEKGIDLKDKLIQATWNKEEKIKYKDVNVETMIFEQSVEPQNREEVEPIGRYLAEKYLKFIKTDKIADVELSCKYDLGLKINGKESHVPLYCKPDATIYEGNIGLTGEAPQYPLDWKVSGYGSKSGVSPKPGYLYSIDLDTGKTKEHKKYYPDMPLDEVDIDWATQLCTYGWVGGITPFTPFPAFIHMLAIRSHSIQCAVYRGIITAEFQQNVALRYYVAWNTIRSGKILNKLSSERLMNEIMANSENWWG